ncbi:redox-sensitive transcriptional activator SoxR [Peredibacter sp. HCB2-198]|uniref:redox-sensitive transcriptional activator SoxR n=1 Tax=Peredibacter sp. HCB2-198 TaxID=3383025 RepID=UPI0038B433C7
MSKIDLENLKTELSVGEVAARSGVAVSAIHFYEEKGLISSRRNKGNQRRFKRDVLRIISLIKVAQGLGIPLEAIKKALDTMPKNRQLTGEDWHKLSSKWKEDLNERITKMTRMRDQLTHCIGCGCLSLKECPLRNPLDKLSEKGTGAVLLE